MDRFPSVPLSDVLSLIFRPEVPAPDRTYRQIGVRLWGEGAYEREPLDGSRTRYVRLSLVETDDVILNKIWARNGSVAVVPPDLSGCYATAEFPTFVVNRDKVDPQWIRWLTKSRDFWMKCDVKSRGTSGKNRIRPERFLEILIPLPPLKEQRRTAGKIEELTRRIKSAERLNNEATADSELLWQAILRDTFQTLHGSAMTVEDVCVDIIDNLHSTPSYDGTAFPCIRSQDIGWGTIDFASAQRVSEHEFEERTRRGEPHKADIVYVREGDVGRCAVVDGSQRFCLGQRVMMFRPVGEIIDSWFMMYQLMSPQVLRDQVLTSKAGTTSHHVNVKYLKKVRIRVPPFDEQRRIVHRLRILNSQVDDIRRLHHQVDADIGVMLPSILDSALEGEL